MDGIVVVVVVGASVVVVVVVGATVVVVVVGATVVVVVVVEVGGVHGALNVSINPSFPTCIAIPELGEAVSLYHLSLPSRTVVKPTFV